MALQKYSGLPTNKVVGMAGILDSSRFKYFLSQELKVPVKNISTLVLGCHVDTMVPMPNRTTVNGKPLNQIIKKEKWYQIPQNHKLETNTYHFYRLRPKALIQLVVEYINNNITHI